MGLRALMRRRLILASRVLRIRWRSEGPFHLEFTYTNLTNSHTSVPHPSMRAMLSYTCCLALYGVVLGVA